MINRSLDAALARMGASDSVAREIMGPVVGLATDVERVKRQQLQDFIALSGGSSIVTALPTTPVDGAEIVYQNAAMAALGVLWKFRYNAASASAHKWEFSGGSAWWDRAPSLVTTTSGTNVDLASGPSITIPLKGEYTYEGHMLASNSNAGAYATAEFVLNGTGTSNLMYALSATASQALFTSEKIPAASVTAAGHVLKLMYRIGGSGTASYQSRFLAITPVRVSL